MAKLKTKQENPEFADYILSSTVYTRGGAVVDIKKILTTKAGKEDLQNLVDNSLDSDYEEVAE